MSTSVTPSKTSERRAGLTLVAGMAALMWAVEIVDAIAGGRLDAQGIRPRAVDGFDGILWSPFLHGGWGHLVGNTIPFLVLGAVIALSGIARVALVTVIVAFIGGLGTWLVAPENTVHIGASGVVFGYAAYLVARGFYTRSLLHLAAGAVVALVFGSTLLWGLVPRYGISWQGHLFGAIGGIVAARLLAAKPAERPGARDPLAALR